MELPHLTTGLLEEEEEDRTWEPPVRNLDKFFTAMYHYHHTNGLPTILITQLCNVITLGFTTTFSTFLLGFIDWAQIKTCQNEQSCQPWTHYVVFQPYLKFSLLQNLFILIYFILLFTYWCWKCYHSFKIVVRALQMEQFYREKLGIKVADLPMYSWNDIVQRLILLHDHGIHRVAIKDKLTEHDVVLRIMRKDNYMIGLINKNILDLRVPWWISPFISERLFLTKSLEWSLSFCIMEYIFNDQFYISTLFLKDIHGLQGRFVMVGLIHLALLPFMIIFMSISFFLQNAQSFHSNKAYLGPRQWSPLALWTFREFNELPHVFEERINKSIAPANEYLGLFHNINMIVVAKTASYISGAIIASLLLMSLIAEGIFLYVDIGEHNLLWWLGIFSAVYAGTRSLVPSDESTATNSKLAAERAEQLMAAISSSTHYYPLHWVEQAHTLGVRDEFSELFPYKIKIFMMEVLSVVLTPLVLCFSLPQCAPAIIEFVRDHSRYVEGVGAVCDYSLFDFEQYGDENYGAATTGYMQQQQSQQLQHGKLEQSYLNFQETYPQWRGTGPAGQQFVQRLHQFRDQQQQQQQQQLEETIRQSFYPLQQQQQQQQQQLQSQYDLPRPYLPTNDNVSDNNNNNNIHSAGLQGGTWTNQGYQPNNNNNNNDNSNNLSSPPMPSFSLYRQPSYISNNSSNGHNDNNGNNVSTNNVNLSLLRSVLRAESIDFENDFYWLQQFRVQRAVRNNNNNNNNNNVSLSMANVGGGGGGGLKQSNIFNTQNIYHSTQNIARSRPGQQQQQQQQQQLLRESSVGGDLSLDLSLTNLGDQPLLPSFSDSSNNSFLSNNNNNNNNRGVLGVSPQRLLPGSPSSRSIFSRNNFNNNNNNKSNYFASANARVAGTQGSSLSGKGKAATATTTTTTTTTTTNLRSFSEPVVSSTNPTLTPTTSATAATTTTTGPMLILRSDSNDTPPNIYNDDNNNDDNNNNSPMDMGSPPSDTPLRPMLRNNNISNINNNGDNERESL